MASGRKPKATERRSNEQEGGWSIENFRSANGDVGEALDALERAQKAGTGAGSSVADAKKLLQLAKMVLEGAPTLGDKISGQRELKVNEDRLSELEARMSSNGGSGKGEKETRKEFTKKFSDIKGRLDKIKKEFRPTDASAAEDRLLAVDVEFDEVKEEWNGIWQGMSKTTVDDVGGRIQSIESVRTELLRMIEDGPKAAVAEKERAEKAEWDGFARSYDGLEQRMGAIKGKIGKESATELHRQLSRMADELNGIGTKLEKMAVSPEKAQKITEEFLARHQALIALVAELDPMLMVKIEEEKTAAEAQKPVVMPEAKKVPDAPKTPEGVVNEAELRKGAEELTKLLSAANKDLRGILDRHEFTFEEHAERLNDFAEMGNEVLAVWRQVEQLPNLPPEWAEVRKLGKEFDGLFTRLESIYFERVHLRERHEANLHAHAGRVVEIRQGLMDLQQRTQAQVIDHEILDTLGGMHEQLTVDLRELKRALSHEDHEEFAGAIEQLEVMLEQARRLVDRAQERLPDADDVTRAFNAIVADDSLWTIADKGDRRAAIMAAVEGERVGSAVRDAGAFLARVDVLNALRLGEKPPVSAEAPKQERLYSPEQMEALRKEVTEFQREKYLALLTNYYWNGDTDAQTRNDIIDGFHFEGKLEEHKAKFKHFDHFKEDINRLAEVTAFFTFFENEEANFAALGGYSDPALVRRAFIEATRLMREAPKRVSAPAKVEVVPTPVPVVEEKTALTPRELAIRDHEKEILDLLCDGVFWSDNKELLKKFSYVKRRGVIKKLLKGEAADIPEGQLSAPVEFGKALNFASLDELKGIVDRTKAGRSGLLQDLEAAEGKREGEQTDPNWFDSYFSSGLMASVAEREIARTAGPEMAKSRAERIEARLRHPVETVEHKPEVPASMALPAEDVFDEPLKQVEAEVKVAGLAKRVMDKMRGWFGGSSDVAELAKAQVTGEKTTREREGGEMSVAEKGLRVTGALVGAAMSVVGAKSIPDVIRYTLQKINVGIERKRVQAELERAFDISRDAVQKEHIADDIRAERHNEAIARMKTSIESSKYLSNEQKTSMLTRLQTLQVDYATKTDWNKQERDREVGEILAREIETRVKGSTVVKELGNSALVVGGLYAARGVWYGLHSLHEQAQKVDRKDIGYFGKLRVGFVNGFNEWKEKITSGRAVSTAEAIGTLIRVGGIAYKMADTELLDALPSLDGLKFHGDIGGPGVEAVTTAATVQVQDHVDQILDHYPQVTEIPETEFVAPVVEAPAITLPEDYRFLDPETLGLASVRNGDGITQVLARQIEADPATFGFTGDADEVHLFAVKKALEIAKSDHLDSSWLRADTTVGHVAIVPEARGGEVHAIFRDIQTGNEIPLEELRERGITMKGR